MLSRSLIRKYDELPRVILFLGVVVCRAGGQTPPEEILLKDYKPRSIFIACHLANCCSDLDRVGGMLDRYPNLYIDIGARYAELSPIPRTVSQFFTRYQDRIFYGTDMNPDAEMYRVTFRLLETADEHFYPVYFRKYHWPVHAWALPDGVLKKVYREECTEGLRN